MDRYIFIIQLDSSQAMLITLHLRELIHRFRWEKSPSEGYIRTFTVLIFIITVNSRLKILFFKRMSTLNSNLEQAIMNNSKMVYKSLVLKDLDKHLINPKTLKTRL